MINDKVFLGIWVWYYFMVVIGSLQIINRTSQLFSAKVRYFLIKMKMSKYFKNNAHMKHILHFIENCSIGDWFVLYQMSKNLNKRFFAEFLALLAMTVDPDPTIAPEEPEIKLSPEDIENLMAAGASSSENQSENNDDEEDEESGRKTSFLSKFDGDGGEGGDGIGGEAGLTGKQRSLIKMGKQAKSANKKAMMAAAAMRRKR